MRPALLVLALLTTMHTHAAETVFGRTDALNCYRSASVPTPTDIDACTAAIEAGKLTQGELAATYSNRGILLARSGQLEKAIEDQNTAIQLDPHSASAHNNRANAYYRAARHAEALADYDEAIALSSGSFAQAFYNRALLHKALGEDDAARQDLQEAAKLAPAIYKAPAKRAH
jgi:tetratricopeptide (TPR) repeat protein